MLREASFAGGIFFLTNVGMCKSLTYAFSACYSSLVLGFHRLVQQGH